MNVSTTCRFVPAWLYTIALACAFSACVGLGATAEQTFPVLKIGTQTFTNATITTKAKDYIFVMHSSGMANIKVSQLSDELRETLGYPTAPKPRTNSVLTLAKQKIAQAETPQVKEVEKAVLARLPASLQNPGIFTPQFILMVLGGLAFGYLFSCYCFMLICQKAGTTPGVLVWLPVLQLFPLLRAAGMSPAWFLAFFVPFLNVFAGVLWAIKIVQARSKAGVWALVLLLPLVNVIAILYLAFSDKPQPRQEQRVEIMTLDTA